MVAGFTYRIQLESQLGTTARVVQCFKAWTRLQREGAANLQGPELEHAAAWLEAHRQARWQARRFFSCRARRPSCCGFAAPPSQLRDMLASALLRRQKLLGSPTPVPSTASYCRSRSGKAQ
ncbi:hypothetical protein [Variovorax sp. UC122_21]|uniref:hypothetical protein n=1 Tax=Variovorax sp. UC122_21 TaxID=3374554 RepID=UPI003757ACAE